MGDYSHGIMMARKPIGERVLDFIARFEDVYEIHVSSSVQGVSSFRALDMPLVLGRGPSDVSLITRGRVELLGLLACLLGQVEANTTFVLTIPAHFWTTNISDIFATIQ